MKSKRLLLALAPLAALAVLVYAILNFGTDALTLGDAPDVADSTFEWTPLSPGAVTRARLRRRSDPLATSTCSAPLTARRRTRSACACRHLCKASKLPGSVSRPNSCRALRFIVVVPCPFGKDTRQTKPNIATQY